MKVKIRIRTPKGYAKSTELQLRPLIIGKTKRLTNDTYANKKDNEIYWEVEGNPRDIFRITRNVNRYSMIIDGAFNNKMFKKVYLKKLSDEGKKELKDMLSNQTQVDVIKEATAQELDEMDRSMWSKMKEKFKKVND